MEQKGARRVAFCRWAGVLWVLIALLPTTSYGASQKTLQARLKQRLASIGRRITWVRRELLENRERHKSAREVLLEMQVRLDAIQEATERTRAMLRATSAELALTKRRLRAAQKRLDEHTRMLSERLVAVQRSPDPGFICVVLSASSMRDFISREHFLRKVVEADTELLQAIERDKAEVERQKAILESRLQRQRELLRELSERGKEIRLMEEQQRQAILEIERNRAELEAMLEQQERDSEMVKAMLARLSSSPRKGSRLSRAWSGGYSLPVRGSVTSRFGYRVHPILGVYKMHAGVDIAAPYGSPVTAAASGTVVYSGWLGGYGKVVIIDHGNGTSTLYGHCSKLLVKVGEEVRQGQEIAKVGSTGFSTGPHLHFEKRLNGVPVNPLH